MLHEAGIPRDVFVPVMGDGATGAALTRQPVDGGVLHGILRDRHEDRGGGGPPDGQGPARARRQGPGLRLRRRRRQGGRGRRLADGAFYNSRTVRAARSSGSTCTNPSTTRSSRRSSPRSRASRSATRWTRPRTSARSRAGPARRARRSGARRADEGRDGCSRWPASPSKGDWFEPTVFADVDHSMALMRDESFGPIIGIQARRRRRGGRRPDERHRVRPHRRRLTRDRERANRLLARADARQRLLELLRPRQPPPAVEPASATPASALTLVTYGIQTFTRPKAWHGARECPDPESRSGSVPIPTIGLSHFPRAGESLCS